MHATKRRRPWARVAAVWLLLLGGGTAMAAPPTSGRYLLYGEQGPVGQLQVEQRRQAEAIVTLEQWTLRLLDRGGAQTQRIEVEYRESEDGRPLRWQQRVRAGGNARARRLSIDAPGRGVLHESEGGSRVVAVPEAVAFPARLAALAERALQGEPQRALVFDPIQADWRTVRLMADPDGDPSRLWWEEGETRNKVRWDAAGRRVLRRVRVIGTSLELRPCLAAACEVELETLDPFARLTWTSPYRLRPEHLTGRVRYLLAGPREDLASVPKSAGQERREVADRLVLTVCFACAPEREPGDLAAMTRSTDWLQSDAHEIRALARAAGSTARVEQRMARLVRAVQERMNGEVEYFDYASAKEAARTRRGDCTEAALLLAASARSAGIPARVVAGMAYASRFTGRRDVFSPHMWVQAWDGERWQNFDAGLGAFSTGHIALAIGDGAPQQYADVMARIARLRVVDAAALPPAASKSN